MLGEATDHFAQSDVDEMNKALENAEGQSKSLAGDGSRSFPGHGAANLGGLLSRVPGASSLCRQAEDLERSSQEQEQANTRAGHNYGSTSQSTTFAGPPGSVGGPPGPGIPGTSPTFDPAKTASQIYPILEFRDKVVKMLAATIERIPGLEALVEKITDTLTVFVLSLLAPFIRPIIDTVSKQLKAGSSSVVDASGKHQYEPWTDPHCSDPTHSLLSKDHFSNILNEPAGNVAAAILQYVAPRVIHAWEHVDIPVEEVLNDVSRVFHHPAIRDPRCEIQRTMYEVVERWAHAQPNRGADLERVLSSDGVRAGRNHKGSDNDNTHEHGGLPAIGSIFSSAPHKTSGTPWDLLKKLGKSTGLTREAEFESNEAAYGTHGRFDASRPLTGPSQQDHNPPYGYSAAPEAPSYHYDQSQQQHPYGADSVQFNSYQSSGYDAQQQPWAENPGAYPPQQQQPQYDQNPYVLPPPQQQPFGYGGGPPGQGGQYYGGGGGY